jgi:hypothetical protein
MLRHWDIVEMEQRKGRDLEKIMLFLYDDWLQQRKI